MGTSAVLLLLALGAQEPRLSDAVGGPGGKGFEDAPPGPVVLAGLRLCTTPFHDGPIVKAVRPLYQAKDRAFEGPWLGAPAGATWTLLARPGYAVGALELRGDQRVRALRVVFMRLTESGLDPKDAYASETFGGGAADGARLGGDGRPVVGLHGRGGADVDALGLVQAPLPGADLAALRDAARRPAPARRDVHGDLLPDGALDRLGTLRVRDHRGFSAAAGSPDGASLAVSGNIGPLRVWDLKTGAARAAWRVGYQPARTLAWSPDGARLAASFDDGKARIFDPATGREQIAFPCAKGAGLAFSPDGKFVAVAQADASVVAFDAVTAKEVRRLEGLERPAGTVAWSGDGAFVAGAGEDGQARVWDLDRNASRNLAEGVGARGTTSVAFAPGGRRVLARLRDGTLRLWDAASGKQLRVLEKLPDDEDAVIWVPRNPFAMSAGGLVASTPGPPESLRIRKIDDGALVREIPFVQTPLVSMEFSPDGRRITVLTNDGALRVLDVETGLRAGIPEGHESSVGGLLWTADGKGLLTAGREGSVRAWTVEGGRPRWVVDSRDGRTHIEPSLAWWPDGASFVEGTGRRILRRAWADGASLPFPGGAAPSGYPITVSAAAGKLFATHHGEGVHAWSLADGATSIAAPDEGTAAWWSLDVSPDGKRLAAYGLTYGKGAVWDLGTALPAYELVGSKTTWWKGGSVFSPDGALLAYSAADRAVAVLDAASGRRLAVLGGRHTLELSAVAWSADGRRIATASWDGSARIWELASGREERVLQGHEGAVLSAAFSPDGRLLATGGQDATALIWQAEAAAADGDREAWWEALADPDPARARPALSAFVGLGEEAAAFLKSRLPTSSTPASEPVKALLQQLSEETPARREQAQKALVDAEAEEAVARALAEESDEETKERLRRILKDLSAPVVRNGETLRLMRAVEVLERIGGPEAQTLLKALSEGSDIRRVREARAALRRAKK